MPVHFATCSAPGCEDGYLVTCDHGNPYCSCVGWREPCETCKGNGHVSAACADCHEPLRECDGDGPRCVECEELAEFEASKFRAGLSRAPCRAVSRLTAAGGVRQEHLSSGVASPAANYTTQGGANEEATL